MRDLSPGQPLLFCASRPHQLSWSVLSGCLVSIDRFTQAPDHVLSSHASRPLALTLLLTPPPPLLPLLQSAAMAAPASPDLLRPLLASEAEPASVPSPQWSFAATPGAEHTPGDGEAWFYAEAAATQQGSSATTAVLNLCTTSACPSGDACS